MIYRALIFYGTNLAGGQQGPSWAQPEFARRLRVYPPVVRPLKVQPGQRRDDTDPILDDFYSQ